VCVWVCVCLCVGVCVCVCGSDLVLGVQEVVAVERHVDVAQDVVGGGEH